MDPPRSDIAKTYIPGDDCLEPGVPYMSGRWEEIRTRVQPCTEYASGIVALPFHGGTADEFARAVAEAAGRLDAGFAFLFHSLSAFRTEALAAALAKHAPDLPHA